MAAARTDFWELELRNRRETAILVVVFIALFTVLGFGLDFRFHDLEMVDGSLTGFPLLTLIALGFGIFASVELILVSLGVRYGSGSAAVVSLLKSTAYNAVTLLWIFYLSRQSQSIPEMELAPRLGLPSVVLGDAISAGHHESFLSMVEQTVEQVLSRNPWPRPARDGSQIVGRKPGPGESN